MHVLKRFGRFFVIAACALALGFGLTTASQIARPQTASASILTTYVASTSEHTMRLCRGHAGGTPCKNVKAGHWSTLLNVNSIQVDAGCELWMSGKRKAKRKDHDWWWNSVATYSKKTIRLTNCRSGGSDSWRVAG